MMIDEDLRTVLYPLPPTCRGYIYEDLDTGSQVCILNANLTHEVNVETALHEFRHVKRGDLWAEGNVGRMETECHGGDSDVG